MLLVHRCGWKEAFDLLGDDRQVIVRYLPRNQALINEKPETDESLLADVSSIMETRNDRFLWVIADPTLNYGEVATHIAAIKSRTSHLKVLIATQSQIAEVNKAFQLSVKDKSAQMISDCPNSEDLRR